MKMGMGMNIEHKTEHHIHKNNDNVKTSAARKIILMIWILMGPASPNIFNGTPTILMRRFV